MPVVTLFDTPQVVNLVEPAAGSETMRVNYPQNRTDFRLVKGVTNHVEWFLRDIDRRPVTLTGRTLRVRIVDPASDRLLMERNLTVIDAPKALLRFTVTPVEIEHWPVGDLRYTVVARTNTTGEEVLLYTDRNYGPVGVVRVTEDPNPLPSPILTVLSTDLVSRDGMLWSGALPGSMTAGHPAGVHTISIHRTGFVGRVTVQGSLMAAPSADDVDWFDVEVSEAATATSDTTGLTVVANLLWVRFKIETTAGMVDRILFRN